MSEKPILLAKDSPELTAFIAECTAEAESAKQRAKYLHRQLDELREQVSVRAEKRWDDFKTVLIEKGVIKDRDIDLHVDREAGELYELSEERAKAEALRRAILAVKHALSELGE